jgi:hypothetical protein
VTTLVYNPVPEGNGYLGIALSISVYRTGENVTHNYMTNPSAGPLKNAGFVKVAMLEFGRYSDWDRYIL